MSVHLAVVSWDRYTATFTDGKYSRAHRWSFDGGAIVPASASPHVVPVPLSDPLGVDPEEAFVAALSSCHMLFFLSFAAERGFVVDRYEDHAVGTIGKDESGTAVMTGVVLHPVVSCVGERQPSPEDLRALHDQAHHACFLANSVRFPVVVGEAPGPTTDAAR